ncbi:nucleoside-diphosphate sugar epimerase [Bradyrhizobium sp. CCBAU 051011]|uniref:SDR family oxidoreductase n=1 Tax=Bradyrhizobium sp. CCBAU 051011 TaxID=858422 RepID=UPI001373E678|nr:SDR family oxidoreductase [Bradyrhizobium sp. CCBAU 051011]QHO73955.1 nucleoside-diphosphate sugar epimerase [Bradyrhizobium sp. CCBAU 051011]
MKIAVIGGTGLIGSAIAAHLSSRGHSVVSMSRSGDQSGPAVQRVDISAATSAAYWVPYLDGIEAIVNCAGVLQDSPGDSTSMVHHHGIANLFAACEQLQIRRVIHFSAIGVDRETPSDFSRSKLAGDKALMERDLDWVILRPSVVIGRPAYGASALMRGLAALPAIPVMPNTGQLQIVLLEDVVRTVEHFLDSDTPARQVVELVGPQRYSFGEVVALIRRWCRWPPAREIHLPQFASSMMYKFGDMISYLGWRPPVRSTAEREMVRGATGNLEGMQRLGLQSKSLSEFFAAEPASVQERWFAGMYLVKPAIFIVLSLFWISTAFVSLGPGWGYGMGLMGEGGVEGTAAALTVIAGALADLVIGIAIAYRPTSRYGLYAAIVISFTYAIVGTILVPRLWADPLGPMLKIWPVIVLHFAALAVLEDR